MYIFIVNSMRLTNFLMIYILLVLIDLFYYTYYYYILVNPMFESDKKIYEKYYSI